MLNTHLGFKWLTFWVLMVNSSGCVRSPRMLCDAEGQLASEGAAVADATPTQRNKAMPTVNDPIRHRTCRAGDRPPRAQRLLRMRLSLRGMYRPPLLIWRGSSSAPRRRTTTATWPVFGSSARPAPDEPHPVAGLSSREAG